MTGSKSFHLRFNSAPTSHRRVVTASLCVNVPQSSRYPFFSASYELRLLDTFFNVLSQSTGAHPYKFLICYKLNRLLPTIVRLWLTRTTVEDVRRSLCNRSSESLVSDEVTKWLRAKIKLKGLRISEERSKPCNVCM